MIERIQKIEQFIDDYVEESISENIEEKDNYQLKYEHTMRVRDNIVNLSNRLNFTQHEKSISEIIGLLHDIGRFKQYRFFNSFSDSITGSHATHSVEMIQEYQLLNGLTDDDAKLIELAIEYHNHFLVPEVAKGNLYRFSTLIRDADKLDAFYLETLEGEVRKYNLGDLSDEWNYSDEVIEDLMNLRQVDFSNFKYKYDRRLGILGLIFNLEYIESLQYVRDYKYIERLIDGIPISDKLQEIKSRCLNYIDRRIVESLTPAL